LAFAIMSWNEGVKDAGETVATALKLFIIIVVLIVL